MTKDQVLRLRRALTAMNTVHNEIARTQPRELQYLHKLEDTCNLLSGLLAAAEHQLGNRTFRVSVYLGTELIDGWNHTGFILPAGEARELARERLGDKPFTRLEVEEVPRAGV